MIQKEKLVEKVAGATGALFQKRLAELGDHPLIGETRGIGLIGGMEIVKDKARREKYPADLDIGTRCRNHCFANGLVMRAIGDTMVLSPPLVISDSEIDELFGLARLSLDMMARDLGVM